MRKRILLLVTVMGVALLGTAWLANTLPTVTAQGNGTTVRVSVATDGTEGNADSGLYIPSALSADGRYVVFDSWANNFVTNDTNGLWDVFLHDSQTHETTRISVASDGTQGNESSGGSSISADGRIVVFQSEATNLVPDDTNDEEEIFIHDRQSGETRRVSVASDGTQGNGPSRSGAISADGRFVTFTSSATNLVANDTNSRGDAFVHDLETGETTLVSVATDGTQGNLASGRSVISGDGRMVAFISYADNLVAGDTNRLLDVFVHDRQTGQTRRVSLASDGTEADDEVYDPGISADGRFVSFTSRAFTLADNDTNSVCDERGNPTPNCLDVFVHELQTGTTTLVSVASDGTIGNAESGMDHVPPALSADGRYVAFWSAASNLVPGCRGDIFIRDRVAEQTTCVSLAWDGAFGNSNSWLPSISADARVIAFNSTATNLVPEPDTNDNTDIFLRIMQTEPSAISLLRPSAAPSRDPLWLVGILLGAALLLLALRGTRKPQSVKDTSLEKVG